MLKSLRNKLDQINERRRALNGRGFYVNRTAGETLEALQAYVGQTLYYISWSSLGQPPRIKDFEAKRAYKTSGGYVRIKADNWHPMSPSEFANKFYPTYLDAERDLLRRAERVVEDKRQELKKARHRVRMIKQRQKRNEMPWAVKCDACVTPPCQTSAEEGRQACYPSKRSKQ